MRWLWQVLYWLRKRSSYAPSTISTSLFEIKSNRTVYTIYIFNLPNQRMIKCPFQVQTIFSFLYASGTDSMICKSTESTVIQLIFYTLHTDCMPYIGKNSLELRGKTLGGGAGASRFCCLQCFAFVLCIKHVTFKYFERWKIPLEIYCRFLINIVCLCMAVFCRATGSS